MMVATVMAKKVFSMTAATVMAKHPVLRQQYITGRDAQGRQAPLTSAGWGDF